MRALVIAVLAAFLLGVLAVMLFSRGDGLGVGDMFRLRSDTAPEATMPLGAIGDPQPVTVPAGAAEVVVQEARAAVERVEQVEVQAGGIDQRVAAMEQRLTRLDLQSQAAAGNAARAEGMLIAFASRRALERGQPLGFLEDQLRLRFGDARPNAVQTIVNASQDPVTLDQLIVRLDGLAPELTDIPEGQGMMTRLGHELSQLFSIRTDDTPSPVAERRLERARIALESGRTERAIAEVSALPNPAAAADWLADAERYRAAQAALEVLETASVLEPRELRDAEGQRVEQPSPAN
ncbi:hypothetical protein E5222_10135 [Alteraurantiacibacter aquimixticola]|uniref:Mitochondrial inner membrane protein n=2 Tax=Alteraurantiacibacter aquimixticola TaxID=2489173 RepID=A0A4T3F3P9_9SPHN|nr:hypothetical protein E5222_10135 [Alteraurantiacibacter aquimixticola]